MTARIGVVLFALTVLSALATFAYFANFSVLTEGTRSPPLAVPWISLLVSLLLSAPIMLVAVVIWPIRTLIVVASVHAAIFLSLLTVTSITSRPGQSLGDSLAPLILAVLWIICAVEFVVIFIALDRSREVELRATFLSTFAGFAMPLVGGWTLGVLIWSETLPAEVIESAEAMAGSKPYCVEMGGRPVDSRRDLVAWSMLAPNNGGYPPYFHALMAIGSGLERSYANWSYRHGRLLPISEKARAALHLDSKATCVPSEHSS